MLFGAHESTSGGFYNAIIKGKEDGCDCVQIFTKSPRSWKANPISDKEAFNFEKHSKELNIKNNVSHASYLLNLANSDEKKRKFAIISLTIEVKRANQLGLFGVVFHPGSNIDKEEGIKLISDSINQVIDKTKNLNTLIIIENTAGHGNWIGGNFEELKKIFDGVKEKKRVGFCFDTCHAFAAGYDLKNKQKKVFNDFDKIIGIKHLKCFHLNDSLFGLGQHKDRHENIGEGKLGKNAFQELVNNNLFKNTPAFLETPSGDYKQEIELLKSLIKK